MKSGGIATVCSCLLAFTAHAAPYGSGFYGELQASVTHENNVARASGPDDVVSDVIASLSAGGGYTTKLGERAELLLTGYVTRNEHEDWDSLSHYATSLGADLIWVTGHSYGAPWLQVKADVVRLDYEDSDIREGYLFNASMSLSKRLGTQYVGQFGVRHNDLVFVDENSAQETLGTAFDTASSEVFVGASHAFSQTTYAYAEYGWRRGGFTSSVSGTPAGNVSYEAETIDAAFDTCATPPCNERYAYRQKADVQAVTLGVSFPVGTVTVDVSGRYFDAKGDNGIRYRNWFAQTGLIWNF